MITRFRTGQSRRRQRWRHLPLHHRLALGLLLLSSDSMGLASGEYVRLHGFAGGLIIGSWMVVNVALVVVIGTIVGDVRRALSKEAVGDWRSDIK